MVSNPDYLRWSCQDGSQCSQPNVRTGSKDCIFKCFNINSKPGGSQGLLLILSSPRATLPTPTWFIHYEIKSSFVKISLRRRQDQTVWEGASSQKIYHGKFFVVVFFKSKDIQLLWLVQKLQLFCWTGGFCLL